MIPWIPKLEKGDTWTNENQIYINGKSEGINPEPARFFSFKRWWTGLLVQQNRTIREKMTLFWYNHMPVDTREMVRTAKFAYDYNVRLRKKCLGNFKELVREICLDRAMLRYLNGEVNTAQAPDENFARELMELFTLGKGPNSQ